MRVLYLGLLIMGLLGTWGEGQAALWVVAIDAGHGGDDTGGIGVDNLMEKDIVLQIAHLIALEASSFPHIKIILTRNNDRYLSPVDRIARAQGAHFFISLHLDFSYDPWIRGIRALVPTNATTPTKALADVLCRRIITVTKGLAWETKTAPLWLRRLSAPAVQLNLGFITNPEEARKLSSLAYQRRLAQAILESISEFVSSSPT
ncbi:MAG: N-acetylmuramoyl-L-alanine amidase [Candidatus Bipolaricaulia bacterium]